MKLKRIFALLLSALFLLSALAGCGTTVVVVGPEGNKPADTDAPASQPPAETQPAETQPTDGGDSAPVKTGLAVVTGLDSSKDASAEGDGLAQSDITLIAVTVDGDGVIDSCVIDTIQAKINFDTSGKLTTDPSTTFRSKNELGDEYGMRKASSIGKEWNEQMAALAQFAVGKKASELKGVAVDESGKAGDADLAASVTLYIGNFVDGIVAAAENARDLGASKGDKLGLASETNMSKSKDASADGDGLAQAYATFAAVTFNGDTVTSCYIDAVQANVNFDTAGKITTDLTVAPQTKNELGDGYGMRKASSIGKEWNEQAAGFCAYVTGKTVAEIKGLAVDESGKAADADLAATTTVGIGEFQTLIEKAAQ